MNLVLTAINDSLIAAWRRYCGDFDFVKIHQGSILEVECDAVVSPANSFGFMDGGIDAIYTNHFGPDVETRVRQKIYSHHHGELLVGQADIVDTGDGKIPFMIAVPTMRVPMRLRDTVNPYLAARAVFILITRGVFSSGNHAGHHIRDYVKTVAMPGLGTGTGYVDPNVCAGQVRAAIDDILLKKHQEPKSLWEAAERHKWLQRNLSATDSIGATVK